MRQIWRDFEKIEVKFIDNSKKILFGEILKKFQNSRNWRDIGEIFGEGRINVMKIQVSIFFFFENFFILFGRFQ